MTKKSPTILFFGTEDFSLLSLAALVDAGFRIGAVITKPDTLRGRKKILTKPAVKIYAEQHNIPVWQPAKLRDITENIAQFDHPVGVLVSYGKIVPQSIIDLFTPGIINLHPSLLPRYRGPSPIEAAIINRDRKTGITLMQLSAAMDAGPIYTQVPYALDFTETQPELYKTLGTLGAHILVRTLPAIIDGSIKAELQDESQATYTHILTRNDAILDLSRTTPGAAEAKIRAHLHYPKTRIRIGIHEVIVTKAHGVMTKKTPLDILCQNGAYLSIDELIAPSGKKLSAEEFLRGYSLS
ncbi:MAG: methionyl-tRNA formyltransferase [Candidatus Saccharimonas sp.]